MAVTDYIFQEETVEKRNFGAWLVGKMVAAGWQQVGSNPPTAVSDPATKFYMMKSKRDADGAEVYISINDYQLRMVHGASYSAVLNLILYTDYTPGAAGTTGTSSRSLTNSAGTGTTSTFSFLIAGAPGTQFAADSLMAVRFSITKTNVTLFTRGPSINNVAGQMLFFGLPDFLQKEKVSSGGIIFGSGSSGTGNDQPIVCDSVLGAPVRTGMYEISNYWINPLKSPDAAGQFPLMPIFCGGTDTGLRSRLPSFFLLMDGGIIDRDIIQISGMNFEIMVAQAGFSSELNNMKTMAYRIS